MATVTDQLNAYVQSVYLVVKGRYFDDITSDDGTTLVAQTIDWTNMFLDELETETDDEGNPVNWTFTRTNGETLGKARVGKASVDWDTDFNNLIAEEGRYVQILQDNAVISNWAVVSPGQITNKSDRITEDMVTLIGPTLVFSRVFTSGEDGGTIIGDVTSPIPRLSLTNIDALTGDTAVTPLTLLKLGTAKNVSLPDIVQGGLSPSYAQKYSDLLKNAIARATAGAVAATAGRDSYNDIGGVY